MNNHQTLVAALIAQLKQGTAPWQQPWQANHQLPFNPVSGTRYRGLNLISLMVKQARDPRWLTYRQASALGAQVRRGEKGTVVEYWRFTKEEVEYDFKGQPILDANGQMRKTKISLDKPEVFRTVVFNAEQINGLPPLAPRVIDWEPNVKAEAMLTASEANITHNSQGKAYYNPNIDTISLPAKAQFSTPEDYYATALHELGHWTGHESRLKRDLSHPFGTTEYAREELRAEIASMLLNYDVGLPSNTAHHAAYVDHWIQLLTKEPDALLQAVRQAEQISRYVQGLTKQQQQTIATAPQSTTTPSLAEKQYLEVPFAAKDQAKALGAKWDKATKQWFITKAMNPAPFAAWQGEQTEVKPAKQSQQTDQRQYLHVPFAERNEARALGAKWDKVAKLWYSVAGLSTKFKAWLNPAISTDPRQAFSEVLREVGCLVTGEHPVMDGARQRIATVGDKAGEKAGFYIANERGGYVMNNRTSASQRWQHQGYQLAAATKTQSIDNAKIQHEARLTQRKADYELTSLRVKQALAGLTPVVRPTPYLVSKGLSTPTRQVFTDAAGDKTYLPVHDSNGKIWSLQTIEADGKKRFSKGGKKTGCFHALDGLQNLANAPVIVIAEGYATAASLGSVLGYGTVAAFDAGNLKPVAEALRAKYPDKPIVIAGDDDRALFANQGLNPGRDKAQAAADAVDGTVMLPIFTADSPPEATDFNDLAQHAPQSMAGQVQFQVIAARLQWQDPDHPRHQLKVKSDAPVAQKQSLQRS